MSLFNFFKRLVSGPAATPAASAKPGAASAPGKTFAGASAAPAGKRGAAKNDPNQPIYDLIATRQVRRLIEFGADHGTRAERLIAAATAHAAPAEIVYIGVDLFEAGAASGAPVVTLRDVYKRLKATQAAVKLLPGDFAGTLGHLALTTSNYDLIVVSAAFAAGRLDSSWAKLARLLQPAGVVFVEQPLEGREGFKLELVESAEIARRADTAGATRPAAATKPVATAPAVSAAPAMAEGRGPRPHFPPTGTTRADEPAAAATSTRKASGRDRSTANVSK